MSPVWLGTLVEVIVSNAIVATLLAFVVAILSLFVRRPAVLHVLWLLVLLKLVTPPLVRVPVLPIAVEPAVVDAGFDTDDSPADDSALVPIDPRVWEALAALELNESAWQGGPVDVPRRVATERPALAEPLVEADVALTTRSPIAAAVLLLSIGAAWILAVAAYRTLRFRKFVRHTEPARPALVRRTNALAGKVGVRRCPSVELVSGRVPPMLWSLFGSLRILMPSALVERLPESERDTLLVHELAHVHRRDHWVRYVELLATCVYWWHPVLWWARRELRSAEEHCCDAWVIRVLPGSARDYANALLETLRFVSKGLATPPPPACGVRSVHQMKRRLVMIMREDQAARLSSGGRFLLGGVAFALLAVFPTWFAPTSAQERTIADAPPLPPECETGAVEEYATRAAYADETPPEKADYLHYGQRRLDAPPEKADAMTFRGDNAAAGKADVRRSLYLAGSANEDAPATLYGDTVGMADALLNDTPPESEDFLIRSLQQAAGALARMGDEAGSESVRQAIRVLSRQSSAARGDAAPRDPAEPSADYWRAVLGYRLRGEGSGDMYKTWRGALASAEDWERYVVRRGDTLTGIARRFRCDPGFLADVNRMSHGIVCLSVGQELIVPRMPQAGRTDRTPRDSGSSSRTEIRALQDEVHQLRDRLDRMEKERQLILDQLDRLQPSRSRARSVQLSDGILHRLRELGYVEASDSGPGDTGPGASGPTDRKPANTGR